MLTGPRIIAGRRPLEIVRLIGVSALQGPSYAAGISALALDGECEARRVRRASGVAEIAVSAAGEARRVRRAEGFSPLVLSASAGGHRVRRAGGASALSMGGSASSLDTSAAALIARMTVRPDVARVSFINDIIRALKAAGLWSKLDVLYFTAAHDAQAARLNWVSRSFTLTAVNSPAFTVDRGYTGGGTAYLDTGADPSTQFTKATLNSAVYGAWVSSETVSNGASIGSLSLMTVVPRSSSDAVNSRVHITSSATATGITSSIGLTSGNRSGAEVTIYRNGSSIGSATMTATGMPTELWLLHAFPATYYAGRVSAAFAGASLDATEQAALFSIANTYMTGVGAA